MDRNPGPACSGTMARHQPEYARTRSDGAVHRYLFARLDSQHHSHLHLVDRDFLLYPVRPDPGRGIRRQREERLARCVCARSRTQLQTCPISTRVVMTAVDSKIERHNPIHLERRWQPFRPQECHHTDEARCASAHANQAEHVQMPRAEGLPGPDEERRSCPKAQPVLRAVLQPGEDLSEPCIPIQSGSQVTHRYQWQWPGQRDTYPQPSAHVVEFCRVGIVRRHKGLKSHTAFRTIPRAALPHLRVHSTGVSEARRRNEVRMCGTHHSRRWCTLHIFRGCGDELGPATIAAEVISLTLVVVSSLGVAGHPAGRRCSRTPMLCRQLRQQRAAGCGMNHFALLSTLNLEWTSRIGIRNALVTTYLIDDDSKKNILKGPLRPILISSHETWLPPIRFPRQ